MVAVCFSGRVKVCFIATQKGNPVVGLPFVFMSIKMYVVSDYAFFVFVAYTK